MAKGKYADRAKNKADADRRHAIAVAEGNELRQKLRQVKHLEIENETLLRRNAVLEHQAKVGSSDRVEELEERVAFLEEDRKAVLYKAEDVRRRYSQALLDLADHTTDDRRDDAWWKMVADIADDVMIMPGHIQGNQRFIIDWLKRSWGNNAKRTASPRETRRKDQQSKRRAEKRAAERPKLDESAILKKLTPAQKARFGSE